MKLTTKTLLPIGLILLVTGCLIISLFWFYLERQIRDDFFPTQRDEVVREAERILSKEDFSSYRENISQKHFRIFFQSLDAEEVVNIVVWNSQGEVVSQKTGLLAEKEKRSDSQTVIQTLNSSEMFRAQKYKEEGQTSKKATELFPHDYELYIPISFGGEESGVAQLYLSNIFISQIITKIALAATLFFILSFLAMFSAMAYFLRHFIIEPLEEVVEASWSLRRGIWDVSLKKRDQDDEIGQLTSAFDHMRLSLKNSFEKIKNKQKIAREAERRERLANVSLKTEKDRSEGILRYLHAIGEGIIATDSEEKITFANLSSSKMITRPLSSLVNKKCSEEFSFVSGDAKQKNIFNPVKKALEKKGVFTLPRDCYLMSPSKMIPVSGSFAPIIKNEQILGTVGVFQDITERRNIEKEKDDFISIAAHQLRTPLTGVRWVLESLLEGDAGRLNKMVRDQLDQILKNSQRLIVLVDDLLDVSRINMGKSKEEPVRVDISSVAKEVIKSLKNLARERSVSLVYEKKCDAVPVVLAGRRHLFQSLENLLTNSIKYTPSGGEVKLLIDVKNNLEEGDQLLVSIIDNGIGIPKKDQEKIFEKFFRASNAVLKETEGSGLGLNVVQTFIQEAGGKIWFKSEEGKGTTFFVELPILEKKFRK